jgi:uncharacterized protein YbjT (DUF2867 family)
MKHIFVSGGTGFIGQAVVPELMRQGHEVTALVRRGSESKLSPLVTRIEGNALDPTTIDCDRSDVFLHLVGTAHPAPWKAAEFEAVDLRSLETSVDVAKRAHVGHFVFLSVAQPAPVMRAYLDVRARCERIIESSGMAATFLRPWYVLGKGRSWPLVLKPLYSLAEQIPAWRDGAQRLGLVTLDEMVGAIAWAIANPPAATRILDVPTIRAFSSTNRGSRQRSAQM